MTIRNPFQKFTHFLKTLYLTNTELRISLDNRLKDLKLKYKH